MATTSKQRLALAICDFLSTSLNDGTLASEDKDSIEVAINCIGESFKVDPADKAAMSAAVGSQNLLQIYGVYEKLKSSNNPIPSASPSIPTAATGSSSSTGAGADTKTPSPEDKARAEELKGKGNKAMTTKDYPSAIDLYTQALALHPGNAIFLSNRAAAYSAARDHESARADAEAAVAIDPDYTKAWSRLGLARFALGDARGSMEAYRQGIEHEGSGGSDAMKKGFETARRRVEELGNEDADASTPASPGARGAGGAPDLSSLAGMFGGGGGGGGGGQGGGMPDLSSIMSNPMFANMAQSLMSNPDMMQNLMSNPRLREMANSFTGGGGPAGGGGGGGMPDLGSLMSDPNIAEMARNMMGGGAGRGAPGSGQGQGQ
ncbi:Uu.00g008790.m01.CDS01 [Anthostomella pinea]|uniref:Uu.00g008790.m01.CDS01 n=1 Tax=Anthostomella pinea TaxID=933095 RepID=A0AAI8VXX0_9PEZI|nr:Uu.00g008790.m01.CDS01 [Anthostomella pinea]